MTCIWWGKKIKTYKSYLKSIKKKKNDDVENCGSFKSFGFIYIYRLTGRGVQNPLMWCKQNIHAF